MAEDLALMLHLDRKGPRPLKTQLLEQLRHALMSGQLANGRKLPATRTLAEALRISRMLAEQVYDELAVQGYLRRSRGSGTYVDAELPPLPTPARPAAPATSRWLRQTWNIEH